MHIHIKPDTWPWPPNNPWPLAPRPNIYYPPDYFDLKRKVEELRRENEELHRSLNRRKVVPDFSL